MKSPRDERQRDRQLEGRTAVGRANKHADTGGQTDIHRDRQTERHSLGRQMDRQSGRRIYRQTDR